MDPEPLIEARVQRRSFKRVGSIIALVIIVGVAVAIIAVGLALGLRPLGNNPTDVPNGGGGEIEPTLRPGTPAIALPGLSEAVRKNMDMSANPCEDFFQFSCGGWLFHNIDADQLDRFQQVSQSNIESLRKSIERGNDSDVPAVQLAKRFYDSCMDTDAIESRGSQPLLDIVRETGGWSAIGVYNCTYVSMWSMYACRIYKEFL